jgi:ATP-dependent DNA ligase
MRQLPPIDLNRLANDRRTAEGRRHGSRGHHHVHRGLAFVAEKGAAVAARYEPTALPLTERKRRLAALLGSPPPGIDFSPHEAGDGEACRRAACSYGLEGVVSKRLDRSYLPDDRKAWIKTKCLNRGEFVVAGWSDPEGSRPYLGSLLLAYHDDNERLLYAGRVGTGMSQKALAALHARLAPLAVKTSPLAVPPPRETRFGGRLALSRVHWVRPVLVAEITYLTWADDGLLRHTVFVGLRDDKPPREVRRERPT